MRPLQKTSEHECMHVCMYALGALAGGGQWTGEAARRPANQDDGRLVG